MSGKTDATLVDEALKGATGSFCVLVRRYQDHAYGVALGVLADFDLALDAAQDAFLCAYCDLPKLKDPTRFGAWLCGIARNTAFEVSRDRQRQQSLVRKAAELAGTVQPAPSAQQLAAQSEERLCVQQALLRLKEKDREALTLHYADGLTYSEICGFLSISLGALKGRLQRGRAALRKELAMIEHACKDNAPDEAFSQRLEEVVRVFAAKGPVTHHIPSSWLQLLQDETRRVLDAGEEGFRIDLALSHAGAARQRHWAAIRFGIRGDDRSLRELERMLEDRAAWVRRTAVRWYAGRIHPENPSGPYWGMTMPATRTVPAVEKLLTRLNDENFNVRLCAVTAVGAYRNTGDPRIVQALEKSLDDHKHKVRHVAARILRVPCPGCGRKW